MDSIAAFAIGEANRGKELMVFDWDKAAKRIKETGCTTARAGLSGDWEWTGGEIFTDGRPNLEDYTFLASTWATPELEINGETEDCFRMQSTAPGWNADTKWPESAIQILA